ncbi:MAG: dodecin family protein [Hyphomicrobiales bacterium]|nr:dodecin family protein [Hyphomicrobiales bacterium]
MAPVHKTIEIMGESSKSWEDAVQTVVSEAAKTVKGIKSVWIKDMSASVNENGKLKDYRVNCKLTFEIK